MRSLNPPTDWHGVRVDAACGMSIVPVSQQRVLDVLKGAALSDDGLLILPNWTTPAEGLTAARVVFSHSAISAPEYVGMAAGGFPSYRAGAFVL